MKLSFIAVTTVQQFRDLLIVRNECRDGLTHDKREITLAEQLKWSRRCWSNQVSPKDPVSYEPYLLYDYEYPVGYGLLKWDGGRYWMTIGVARDYRGMGLSKVLIGLITTMASRNGREVWLDCMEDNLAYKNYVKAG